jgi:hypothetical protein
MNKKLIVVACMALILAGCGDKDDAATGSAEPTMTDKAMEATTETMGATEEMANETAGSVSEAATGAADAVGEAASDTAEGAADAAADAASGAMQDSGAAPAQ